MSAMPAAKYSERPARPSAGLACGPGAPVCSLVLGLGFGFLGGAASRGLAEMIYDHHRHTGGHPATEAELTEFNELWAKGTECPNCHLSVAERNPWGASQLNDPGLKIPSDWFDAPQPLPRDVELTPAEMDLILSYIDSQPQEQGPPAPAP
jgi:hypothetical protein